MKLQGRGVLQRALQIQTTSVAKWETYVRKDFASISLNAVLDRNQREGKKRYAILHIVILI